MKCESPIAELELELKEFESMTLAETCVFEILKRLGYREPKFHPQWDNLVGTAQDQVNRHMEVMVRVAKREGNCNRKRRWFWKC